MQITIAGAGEVGTHLAKMLSKEKHDIFLLDEDREKISRLQDGADVMTVEGSPTSLKGLIDAQVKKADLFIAVTPIESQNITACILAKNLGAKKTLARIDNYEYLLPENKAFFEKLGINAMIYPEMLAAEEIVNSLKMNWVRQWMEFNDGALTLIGMKVRINAPILKQKLMDLKDSDGYRIVAIRRDMDTIIPNGQDEIKPNDIVYFITTKEFIPKVREVAGKDVINVRDLMIMGGSRITVKTVETLPDNISVKVLEKDSVKINRLNELLPDGTLVINSDASDLEVLREEEIESMDAFVALTNNSEANILACIAAKSFGLKKTISEIENIDYIPLAENLDIGTVINKKLIAASAIYQYTLDADVSKVKCLTHVDAQVVEVTAKLNSDITKGKLKDIHIPKNIFIGGIVRNGVGYIANGNTAIEPNDNVIVFCLSSSIQKLDKLFN
ncbi:MAG: Trk system potassium transporter TrkA [Paludibacteraceae bacterium]|nr:Trk system potassium transporter TrkA [Paludibacteraceae bacterium]